jgi:hypothetical protein
MTLTTNQTKAIREKIEAILQVTPTAADTDIFMQLENYCTGVTLTDIQNILDAIRSPGGTQMRCAKLIKLEQDLEDVLLNSHRSADDERKADKLRAEIRDHKMHHNSGLAVNCETNSH